MASSDETFFNLKRLHLIFAVCSTALLGVTVWMLAADHFRSWKVYQRTFRDSVQPWLTEAQIRELETEKFAAAEEELSAALKAARASIPDLQLIEAFRNQAGQGGEGVDFRQLDSAYERLAAEPSETARDELLARLSKVVDAARLQMENADRGSRFRRAEFDEVRSTFEAAVGEGRSSAEVQKLEDRARRAKEDMDRMQADLAAVASRYESLVEILDKITAKEDAASRALEDLRAERDRMGRALVEQRPSLAKRLLRLPIIDAFGRPLAVDQTWLPELTIDYNFRHVARFDRCTTCHLGIEKTKPGSAHDPACLAEEIITVELAVPDGLPEAVAEPRSTDSVLIEMYGLALAETGMLDPDAATVGLVLPLSAAADADLFAGDVIQRINGRPVADRTSAIRLLSEEVDWGEPLELGIRRGLPGPFASHPRLDLYLGSSSPHPRSEFGCTICHQGQGSGTEFKWASHTPNSPEQRKQWRKDHNWRRNQHWDFPMLPSRFVQSGCLKCHPDVTDLYENDRFADPAAPKLLAGYELLRTNGCFGCHEINGFDAEGNRVGPDMRLEPSYHEAAQQLAADPGLSEDQRGVVEELVARPEDARLRQRLRALFGDEGRSRLDGALRAAVAVLTREDMLPGTLRKVGPSLRDTAGRVDVRFLAGWLADPGQFRPETRMPRFYGLHDHLDGPGLADARRFETVEILAVCEYLLAASQPVEPQASPSEVTEEPSAERGEELFVTSGCVACHRHEDVDEAQSVVGPDLSNLGAKFSSPEHRAWLVSWIRDPARHSPRTLMPNLLLAPKTVPGEDQVEGQGGRFTDPAADIAAYLVASADTELSQIPELIEADLDELALEHLSTVFPRKLARQYLDKGIPAEVAGDISGDAVELLGRIDLYKKLRYVGRRTIRKRGCYGCHDVPGFEDGQPIGPALSDFGRKQESLLAFEQVHRFLAQFPPEVEGEAAEDPGFYLDAINGKRREGFIWQKLRRPRSFDFQKTQNKGYNERLTMGQFSFSAEEREAVITFVLGLVSEPPAQKYVHRPPRRRKAIVEGRKVLDKFGCGECHTLRMDRWSFKYDPEWFEGPPELPNFDFVRPEFSTREVAASEELDRRGWGHAEVVGMPLVDMEGGLIEDEDDDGNPLFVFNPWEPAIINGWPWRVGGVQVPVAEPHITRRRDAWGGAFARLSYSRVAEEAGTSWMEAWGWVPPPLVHEGRLVRPDWLYGYLLNPERIRPSVVLRMPKYTLSADEAKKLVDYFAAVAGVEFPYLRGVSEQVDWRSDPVVAQRRDRAMKILIDRTTYCAKCHLVGDFDPGGETQTILAPNLDRVGRRIRPEYLRRWLADPKSVLPYTGMPVNFPPEGPLMGQDLFPGSSLEQLDAVADLLLNYDRYMQGRTSIRAMMEAAKKSAASTVDGG
jgi:hypothetical protein